MSDQANNNNDNKEPTFTQKDLDRERAHAQHFKSQLDEFQNKFKGIDPERFQQMQAELESFKNKDALGDPDKLQKRISEKENELEERYKGKLTELEGRAATAEDKLRHAMATTPALTKLATMVTGEDQAMLLEPVIAREVDFQDGKIIVKGPDGKPRYSKNKPSDLMGLDEYIEDVKGRFPGSFKADSTAGGRSGAQPIKGPNGVEINSLADASRLPDKGRAYFAELAKRDPAKLRQIMNNSN